MAANQRTRLYRLVNYDVFVYATTKKKAKQQFENSTGLKAGKVTWSRYKRIKIPLNELNKGK